MSRRRTRTKTSAPPRLISPGRVGMLILLFVALWVAWGFASKMVVAYRLNAEVRSIQQANQKIADQNKAYDQQLQAVSRPDGAEEQARLHNYVAPGEHVYVVATSPTPTSSARPAPTPNYQDVATKPASGGFWQDLWGALTSAFSQH
jgi:cell division protein FtsB